MVTTFFDLIHPNSNSTARHSQRRIRFHTCPTVDHTFARAPCVSTSCRILIPLAPRTLAILCANPGTDVALRQHLNSVTPPSSTTHLCAKNLSMVSLTIRPATLKPSSRVTEKRVPFRSTGSWADYLPRTDECVSQCPRLSSVPCSRDWDRGLLHFAFLWLHLGMRDNDSCDGATQTR